MVSLHTGGSPLKRSSHCKLVRGKCSVYHPSPRLTPVPHQVRAGFNPAVSTTAVSTAAVSTRFNPAVSTAAVRTRFNTAVSTRFNPAVSTSSLGCHSHPLSPSLPLSLSFSLFLSLPLCLLSVHLFHSMHSHYFFLYLSLCPSFSRSLLLSFCLSFVGLSITASLRLASSSPRLQSQYPSLGDKREHYWSIVIVVVFLC